MDQKCTNDTMFQYYRDLDESFAWLTQKNEELECLEGGGWGVQL